MTRVLSRASGGVLLSDQGADRIDLLRDLDSDGDATAPGERTLFFGDVNTSGLPDPAGNIFTLMQAEDGAVYAGDGNTDAVYRLRDLNGDGDAMDAGEATVWFSEAGNAGGFALPTPNGLAQGPDGAIYVVNAGVRSRPADTIYRTEDLNGDGDAQDAGEATVWLDLSVVSETSAPFEFAFIGDVAYLLDPNGSGEQSIWRIEDADGSGAISADEVTRLIGENQSFGAPIDFSLAADATSLYVWEWLDFAGDGFSLYRLTDLDGSGAIDAAEEAEEVWTADRLPEGLSASVGLSVAVDEDGRVALTSNGGDPAERFVALLEDRNGDGDFLDDGETGVLGSAVEDPAAYDRPRAVAFYQGPTVEGGFTAVALTGVDADDFAGISVADAGDANGDGLPDVLIGAFGANRGEFSNAGETYVVSGAALRAVALKDGAGVLSLADLGEGRGVTLLGDASASTFSNGGWSVSTAGDVDGDGIDDVVVGAWGLNILAGRTYVVYGSTIAREAGAGGSGLIDLAGLDKADGVALDGGGIANWSGYQVADLGDLDADGLDDILIGAGQAQGNRGESYVVFGSAIAAASSADGDGRIDLGMLTGTDGVTVRGAMPDDIMGFQLASAGDVDGDGSPDLIAGGWTGGPAREGRATVVWGSTILDARETGGLVDLATVAAENAVTIDGISPNDALGRSVSGAGDINADGFDELLVGAYLTTVDGETLVGEVHLLDGAALAAETSGRFDLADLSGGRGVTIRGNEQRDLTGFSVADGGDVDGGGAPDILIGAYGLNPISGAYVLFGEALAEELGPDGDGVLDLAALTPEQGVILRGVAATDVAGWQVSRAGDVDGDGLEDVLMGAWEGDLAGPNDAGEAYLISGAAIAKVAETTGVIELSALFPLDPVTPAPTLAGAGNHFSLFLHDGALFSAGENLLGQLAQGLTGFDVPAPLAIDLPEDFDGEISSVSAGLVHGAFLTDDGDVYTWGFGNFGRLGFGDEETRTTPEKIGGALDERDVRVIEMGNGASYAITVDGSLWAWGQNSNGQLGLGDRDERLVPTSVEALADEIIVSVSSGTSHTLALTANGEVFSWGRASSGQLGSPDALDTAGEPVARVLSPVKVEGLPPGMRVVSVTADTQTSYAVLEDGRVFGWGEASFGQLVLGEDNGDGTFAPQEPDVLAPVEIAGLPDNVGDVKGGARWAAALTADGDVWLWGPNDEGPSGGLDGDPAAESDGSFFPTRLAALDEPTVVEIQTGPNHLIAVTDDGRFLTFGSNSDGRLGYPTEGLTTEPAEVDFDGDADPWLLSATPGDNARDVAPDADVALEFTEPVAAGDGVIRFVDRDDPGDVIVVSAADAARVKIDGASVAIDPPGLLRPGARYAVEIDEDAFRDAAGQAYAGLGPEDASSFDFRIGSDASAIIGSDGIDRVRGTDGDDLIWTGAGRSEIAFGGDGADTFVFGAETANGVREFEQIRDYQIGLDWIDLGGAEIASVRETPAFVTLVLDGDGDSILVRGVSDVDDILFA